MWEKHLTEVDALDRELERLHNVLGDGDAKANGYILQRIKEIENILIQVTKKKNGMEW